jgi:hypothetical protein
LKGEDSAAIESAMKTLEGSWHKAAESLYKSTEPSGGPTQEKPADKKPGDSGAVDADFEVVN